MAGAGYCRGVDGRRASEVVRWGLRTGMEERGWFLGCGGE